MLRLLLGHPANSEVSKLPFRNSSSGRRFFRKHSGKPFSGNFPEEEFVISGSTQKQLPEERHPECFQKKLLPEDIHLLPPCVIFFHPECFQKKLLPEDIYLLPPCVIFFKFMRCRVLCVCVCVCE